MSKKNIKVPQSLVKEIKQKEDKKIKLLNAQQERMKSSKKLKLISFTNDKRFIFHIHGDTDNYFVMLDKNTKLFSCNCKDAEFYALENNLLCKHKCFVLTSIFPFYYKKTEDNLLLTNEKGEKIKSEFMMTKKFTSDEYNIIYNKLKNDFSKSFSMFSFFRDYIGFC